MAEQIVHMKLSDLRKLLKEVMTSAPKPEYVKVDDFMQKYGKTAREVRYMRENTYPELFKKFNGRWKINIEAYKQVA